MIQQFINIQYTHHSQLFHDEIGYQQKRTDDQAYDLMCCAIELQDEEAWTAVYHQYRKLVLKWIYGSIVHSISLETAEELVQATFFRFWRALRKYQACFSEKFPHIGAILKYMKFCTMGACRDWERHLQKQKRLSQKLVSTYQSVSKCVVYEDVAKWIDDEMRLEHIWDWMHLHLANEEERLIVQLTYELGWKPTKIVHHYPYQFSSVCQVKRIKDRIIKRAQRAMISSSKYKRISDHRPLF